MADTMHNLIFGAVMKRATLLEQWLVQHAEHYPGPHLEIPLHDSLTHNGRCSCGESIELTISIDFTPRVIRK